jgi:hypothetical protein
VPERTLAERGEEGAKLVGRGSTHRVTLARGATATSSSSPGNRTAAREGVRRRRRQTQTRATVERVARHALYGTAHDVSRGPALAA